MNACPGTRDRVIYVSGPYRADSPWGVFRNIYTAMEHAHWLWLQGWTVICPHSNTAFMDGKLRAHDFIGGDLEIVRRCDVIYMLPGWDKSDGARMELATAMDNDLEVIYGEDIDGKDKAV